MNSKLFSGKCILLNLNFTLSTAIRMPKGNRHIRIDLVNAATRNRSTITKMDTISKSSLLITHIDLVVTAIIPSPGLYFIIAYVDDEHAGTILLPAETESPQYSVNLQKDAIQRINSGELILLSKRSYKTRD